MSYRTIYDQLPVRRFATVFGGRAAAANYHGARIARLLATKMGMRPVDVLPLMARPLAREAARSLGLPQAAVVAGLVADADPKGGCDGR